MKHKPDNLPRQAGDEDDGKVPVIPLAWAIILSVLVVMGGLFVGLPMLLQRVPWAAARLPVLLLVIPAFPAVTGWLQGTMDTQRPSEQGWRALPREYLFHAWSLALELTLVVSSLPVIAAQLLSVIALIMLFPCGAVLLLAAGQKLFGLHIEGVTTFSASDVWLCAMLLFGAVAAAGVAYALAAFLERVFDRSTDVVAVMNKRVVAWLCRRL